jgi:hypothetical protein
VTCPGPHTASCRFRLKGCGGARIAACHDRQRPHFIHLNVIKLHLGQRMHVESRTSAAPKNIGLASYRVSTPFGIAEATTVRNLQSMLSGIPRTGISG